MSISLSGYVPSGDDDGLTELAEQLVNQWNDAARHGDDPGEATEVVVVGLLRGTSLKTFRDPSVKPPTIELRFVQLEAVRRPGQSDQLTSLLRTLRDERMQNQPIPGIDHDPALPDPNNVAEPDRPNRRAGEDGDTE